MGPAPGSFKLLNGIFTSNLPTNIVGFRGFDSSIFFILRLWNSQAHRESPGKLESSNVSRDNVSRRIGRRTGLLRDLSPIASKSGRLRDLSFSLSLYLSIYLSLSLYTYIYIHGYMDMDR